MKHTIDDVKKVNPEFRMYHNRIGLFNSHFQNFKQFGVPKAQLILTDIPYNIGKNAYGSNPVWYVGGDNKNGESDLAGEEFFDTDKDFRPAEFMHFCSQMLKPEPKEKGKAPCMIVFCEFEQQFYLIELARRYGLNNYINLVFRKNYSAQVLKANMRVVGNCEYGLILYRDKLPKFNNHGQMIFNCFDWSRDLGCQKIHPTQKPLALLRQLVELFTDPDDVVIDPCAGSGSSLIAAAGLNRKAYGFEIKKNIYSDACDLIKHNIQFDLFAESQQMERRRQAMYDTRTLFDVNETKEDEK
jgi:site-specific DNA-methyltransferase (adenine-specific)